MPIKKRAVTRKEQEQILHAKLAWEQTFDAVSDLIFITDTDYTIIRANRAMAERFGITLKELIGRKCFEVMHCTQFAPDHCLHSSVLESGEPQTSEFNVENPHGIVQITMSPLYNAEGQIRAIVHVARDVTEKRRQEELLASQQKQLEEINSSLERRITEAVAELRKKDDILIQQSRLTAMSEMISSIAHQWRQPLNNIGLIVQNLQLAFKAHDLTEQELDADVADAMKVLQQMSETIDDFRNFFSYEEETSTFVVNDVFSRALSFIVPSMKRKGIRIKLEEEPGVIAAGYPNEYMQSFLNIMLNAKDTLMDRQVEKPFIAIRLFQENGRSIVTIRDNGGGIREDVLPKIFDPYFTTKKQCMGGGIGLYMAKMIIEKKMHGHLSACNVDAGAEFRIEV
jgi:PAS domain S-box-containing protein